MTLEGAEPVGLSADRQLIDGQGNVIPTGGSSSDFFVSAVDPGAVGAGRIWMDTSGNDGLPMMMKIRANDDSQWTTIFGFDVPAAGLVPVYLLYGINADSGPDGLSGSNLNLGGTSPTDGLSVSLAGMGVAFTVYATGELSLADTANNNFLLRIIPGGGDNLVTFSDGNGQDLFAIDADGDLHGRTGKALTFDL